MSARQFAARHGWAIAAVVVVAAIEPLSHGLLLRPVSWAIPTGLHTVDTGNYLAAMRFARPPCYSPFASCHAAEGPNDPTHYVLAHHRLYGAIGRIADGLGADHFQALAWVNALGIAAYLLAAYALLLSTVPHVALRAFLIFAVGGGLGGVLYAGAAALGLHRHAQFAEFFQRYFLGELTEGPHFQPWLLVERLYYTFPLALGMLALLATSRAMVGRRGAWAIAGILFAATALLNFRIGPMLGLVGTLIVLLHAGEMPIARRVACVGLPFAAACAGAWIAWRMAARNPELIAGVSQSQRAALWLSPFVSATFFHWFAAPLPLARAMRGLNQWLRPFGYAALGYLIAFVALYIGYQAYYGNIWRCLDFTAALNISDWALLGGVAGIAHALLRREPGVAPSAPPAWYALWFLGFFIAAISAWGHGWWLRFTPDRCAVVLGLPLAVLTAWGIESYAVHWPRLARLHTAAIVTCGLASMAVTWIVTYGPYGFDTLQRQYSWTRYAYMTPADSAVLGALGNGCVLAPSLDAPVFGDFIALRPDTRVVYANGTLDFTRHVAPELRTAVNHFFAGEATDTERRQLIDDWCVDWVLCTDTTPVAEETVQALRATPWLQERAAQGRAVLFAVTQNPGGRTQ